MLKKIEIQHELDFDELCSRLRKVSLRGFPNVRIYEDAKIEIKSFNREKIMRELFTPQPSVYKPILDNIAKIIDIFSAEEINIFKLNAGFDYIAFDENNEITEWTIIPPVIEVLPIKFNLDKGLDYSSLIGEELKMLMKEKDYELNPELQSLNYFEYAKFMGKVKKIPEICDGSHRIEVGLRRGLEQNLLFIESPKPGFPYYAAPKPCSSIHEEAERIEEKIDKTHVLTAPGHKILYRLFPSGGINTGTLRPLKQKFD